MGGRGEIERDGMLSGCKQAPHGRQGCLVSNLDVGLVRPNVRLRQRPVGRVGNGALYGVLDQVSDIYHLTRRRAVGALPDDLHSLPAVLRGQFARNHIQ